MHYTEENVLNSKRAYQILRAVATAEGGSYATAISKEHDLDRSLTAELLSQLSKMGLVEKGERKRAQYYVLDEVGLLDQFDQLWDEIFEQSPNDTAYERGEPDEPVGDQEADRDEQMRYFLARYVREYLDRNDTSSIRDMLVDDFYRGLSAHEASLNRAREALQQTGAEDTDINQLRLPFYVHQFLQRARRHRGPRDHAERAAFHAFLDMKKWGIETFRSMVDSEHRWAYQEFFDE